MYFKPQLAFDVGIPTLNLTLIKMQCASIYSSKNKLNKLNGFAPFFLFLLKRRGGVC